MLSQIQNRRYEMVPSAESGTVLTIPPNHRRLITEDRFSERQFRRGAVDEFLFRAETGDAVVNPELHASVEQYRDLAEECRHARTALLQARAALSADALPLLHGRVSLFDVRPMDGMTAVAQAETRLQKAQETFFRVRDAVRRVFFMTKKDPKRLYQDGINPKARTTTFALARSGDARKKYRQYQKDQEEIAQLARACSVYADVLRLRQTAETETEMGSNQSTSSSSVMECLAKQHGPDLDQIAERVVDAGLVVVSDHPETRQAMRAQIRTHLLTTELVISSEEMRNALEAREQRIAEKRLAWEQELKKPEQADLVEFLQEKEFETVLRDYHLFGKRFLPVGEIREDVESLERLVTSSRGPILRALLYGPPGTGKTEGLREVGHRNHQRVRVISLHETSTFETLVGMHQIPIPRAETLADAERYYKSIETLTPAMLAEQLPEAVLHQFSGHTDRERALDFRVWFACRMKMAQMQNAVAAVAPEDSRAQKIRQEALAAWVDQPLAVALMQGDLVILDEADRAGNALEGLQDLLTRKPGDWYHPPGRPEPFQIHPRARIVMTANWGDLQTEFSGGGGRLAAPIVSRVFEKRKINYLKPETEQRLFEIMTTNPHTKESLLHPEEHAMMRLLIEKAFPRLRDLYLKPGELQFVSPISVRTLENMARRLVDETTYVRTKDGKGVSVHMIEAIWTELAGGPFREDQTDTIRELIARTLSDAGVWNLLGETTDATRLEQVSRLTGISQERLQAFMGGTASKRTLMDFSFGNRVMGCLRATNEINLRPHPMPSPAATRTRLERIYDKQVTELCGTPEVQRALDQVVKEWIAHRNNYAEKVRMNAKQCLSEDVRWLVQHLRELSPGMGEIQAFYARLKEQADYCGKTELSRLGLFLSILMNEAIGHVPEEKRQDVHIVLEDLHDIPLDYLGYQWPAGILEIRAQAGEQTGMCIRGGEIRVLRAGKRCGTQMGNGKIVAGVVGDEAANAMKGGEFYATNAGHRLAQHMTGGKVSVAIAGDYVGNCQNGGEIVITQKAGIKLGEGQISGTIRYQDADSIGKHKAIVQRLTV